MAPPDVQSQHWPSDRAVLFVHGVGNAKPGAYAPLVQQVQALLGASANEFAYYFFYYDQINEWFAEKESASVAFTKLVRAVAQGARTTLDDARSTDLGNVIADFAGDVIWPVLLPDARLAVRAALLAQLNQIRLDGIDAGHPVRRQKVSIIAHSMGCFHVYEALCVATDDPTQGLGPASSGNGFTNVVLMASPVQLIRTVAGAIGGVIPQLESIQTISRTPLAVPAEPDGGGGSIACTPRFVSITGNLDPVGGYVFRRPYAYMDLGTQQSFVDQQQVALVDGSETIALTSLLQSALRHDGPPEITPQNPHDWSAYVARHATDLAGWLTA